jgi:hypothetical protein
MVQRMSLVLDFGNINAVSDEADLMHSESMKISSNTNNSNTNPIVVPPPTISHVVAAFHQKLLRLYKELILQFDTSPIPTEIAKKYGLRYITLIRTFTSLYGKPFRQD